MILHEPFIIGPNLRPALKVGNGILSLASMSWVEEPTSVLGKRMEFGFYLDTPDFEYFHDRMQSGCGGYNLVEAFEGFLGFLEAAVESYRYKQRYPGAKGENTDLFPRYFALAGERDAAVAKLTVAIDLGFRDPLLGRDPAFTELRDDPELKAQLTRMTELINIERAKLNMAPLP